MKWNVYPIEMRGSNFCGLRAYIPGILGEYAERRGKNCYKGFFYWKLLEMTPFVLDKNSPSLSFLREI
jgi:hypothetical protein